MEDPGGERLLMDLLAPRNNSSNVTFSVNAGGVGVWLATGAALICFLLAVMIGFMYLDVRNEVRAQRQDQAIMNNWTSQEITAIRSYITNGKLQPMQPRPIGGDVQGNK